MEEKNEEKINEDNKIIQDTNIETKNIVSKKPIKIKFSDLVLIIIVTIIILGALAFIIINQHTNIYYLNNHIEQLNYKIKKYSSEISKLKNEISDLQIAKSKPDVNTETNTIEEKENINESIGSNLRRVELSKVKSIDTIPYEDSNLNYNIIYYNYPISEKLGLHSVPGQAGPEATAENKSKFITTYYSYKSDGYMRKIEPSFEKAREEYGELEFTNIEKIAVSKNYDLMPRTIEYDCGVDFYSDYENDDGYYDYYDNVNAYYSDKDLLGVFAPDIARIDLNGDGNYIYIKYTREKINLIYSDKEEVLGLSFNYDVFDKEGNHLATLVSIVRPYEKNYDKETAPSLKEDDSIVCADLDGDGKMELIVEIPWYEYGRDVSIYKYENGKILGETELIRSIEP